MLTFSGNLRVMVCLAPVDMRNYAESPVMRTSDDARGLRWCCCASSLCITVNGFSWPTVVGR